MERPATSKNLRVFLIRGKPPLETELTWLWWTFTVLHCLTMPAAMGIVPIFLWTDTNSLPSKVFTFSLCSFFIGPTLAMICYCEKLKYIVTGFLVSLGMTVWGILVYFTYRPDITEEFEKIGFNILFGVQLFHISYYTFRLVYDKIYWQRAINNQNPIEVLVSKHFDQISKSRPLFRRNST